MVDPAQSIFGTYYLSPLRKSLLAMADHMPAHKLGRWAVSLLRKSALAGKAEPLDIVAASGLKLRLYPYGNRCEKRMIAGPHHWDAPERGALVKALEASASELGDKRPFVFLDVGANVGLYSLTLWSAAKQRNLPFKAYAIEPDTINAQRLLFNVQASGADIAHIPFAVGGEAGQARMVGGETNRGEVRIEPGSNNQLGSDALDMAVQGTVTIKTLVDITSDHHLDYIDAMKVDVEGHDFAALNAFFMQAPEKLWPKLLVIETGRGASKVLDLCLTNGYTTQKRTQINAILVRSEAPDLQ
ncbi:MAG: hypothetical protein COA52_05840 [Hyphomicrobiales bacterium]|nr:MAG: hypothetical protein COA52_05840 [Hyphomicrobiales bacterium]